MCRIPHPGKTLGTLIARLPVLSANGYSVSNSAVGLFKRLVLRPGEFERKRRRQMLVEKILQFTGEDAIAKRIGVAEKHDPWLFPEVILSPSEPMRVDAILHASSRRFRYSPAVRHQRPPQLRVVLLDGIRHRVLIPGVCNGHPCHCLAKPKGHHHTCDQRANSHSHLSIHAVNAEGERRIGREGESTAAHSRTRGRSLRGLLITVGGTVYVSAARRQMRARELATAAIPCP